MASMFAPQESFADVMEKIKDAADDELCLDVNQHFSETHMLRFVSTILKDSPNGLEFSKMAEEVSEWCKQNEMEGRRRILEEGNDAEFLHEDAWDNYIESLYPDANGNLRRLSNDEATLPPDMYEQCAGYATAVAMLAANDSEEGADVFGVSSKGTFNEKKAGCGAVVNKVNAALEAGEIAGLEVVQIGDDEIVAVVDPRLQRQLGAIVTTMTLATGAVVTKLMHICTRYQKLLY